MKKSLVSAIATRFAACFLALSVVAIGCQKDNELLSAADAATENTAASTADDRAITVIFGVTVYSSTSPSVIVRMDLATGAVLGTVNVMAGATQIKDIKGICEANGIHYVTTGNSAGNPVAYRRRVLRVDPFTGVVIANTASTSPYIASDGCWSPDVPNSIFNLSNNTNAIVEINTATWARTTFPITGMPAGFTARGLSWAHDPATGADELLMVAAHAAQRAKLFRVDIATGAAIFIKDLDTANYFRGAHTGMGFFGQAGKLLINRNALMPHGRGLNSMVYPPLLVNPHPTAIWGGATYNFEDLCTMF